VKHETPGVYRLAFDEAVRALAHQQSRLDDFRARAGIVLSAAAIATSVFGGQALAEGSPSILAWIAVASFIGVSVLALVLLWPREWIFSAVPRRIIATYVETDDPLPLPMIHRDLALHMEDSYVRNEQGLDQMLKVFQWALVLLALEVVTWTIELATRG
jgi:hypothetical protein